MRVRHVRVAGQDLQWLLSEIRTSVSDMDCMIVLATTVMKAHALDI